MSGKMMRDLSDAVDDLAAWAEKDRGKGFVLRAADNNADPAKVGEMFLDTSELAKMNLSNLRNDSTHVVSLLI